MKEEANGAGINLNTRQRELEGAYAAAPLSSTQIPNNNQPDQVFEIRYPKGSNYLPSGQWKTTEETAN